MIEHIISTAKKSLLVIDADPNSNLPELLGVKDPKTIVGMVEGISKNLDKIPKGISKDRFIESKIQQEGLVEEEGFDLLVMGRPEGPGCYCYVNNLLRNIIGRITKGYDFVVIDNAAGMEHISRRTEGAMDKLVIVSDYSAFGIRSAKSIYNLAKELGIKIGGAFLILNKLSGPVEPLNGEIKRSELKLVGTIPYKEEIGNLSLSNRPIFELKDKSIAKMVEEIFNNLTRG